MARFCPPFTILYDLAGRKEVKIVLKFLTFRAGYVGFLEGPQILRKFHTCIAQPGFQVFVVSKLCIVT